MQNDLSEEHNDEPVFDSAQESEHVSSHEQQRTQQTFSDSPQQNSAQVVVHQYFSMMRMDISTVADVHHRAIYQELNWLLQVLWCRYNDFQSKEDFQSFLGRADFKKNIIRLPKIPAESHYGQWLMQHRIAEKAPERLLMAVIMALSLNDAMFFSLLELLQRPIISVFVGGQTQDNSRRFLPTFQTLLYLLAGVDLKNQANYQLYFRAQQISLDAWGIQMISTQSRLTGRNDLPDEWKNLLISLKPNIWQFFLGGEMPQPEDNQDLPLTKLETSLNYEDLVLKQSTRDELRELIAFARSGQEYFADKEASGGFKKGFIALLHGEPGTGKTLIATTIGKHVGLTTYQLEMSEVVSKYIGETSQNLNKVFDELQRTIDWLQGKPSILFIDEADAILGKRSEVNDSKDRYANLDVSNLLQRVEKFPGLIILATNFQQNIDPAFHRRIQVQVHVPPPDADERTQLWKNYCPPKYSFPAPNFARMMGEKFALTGAQINNILKRATVLAHSEGATVLDFEEYLEQPLKSELIKDGKVYSRPRDMMSLAQMDEHAYQQQLLWEAALPGRWQYIPIYLPRILSQAVSLAEEDIKALVKKVKRKWEGGAYNHIPFKEGIEVVLRDLCPQRNLDWRSIRTEIYRLMKKEQTESPEEMVALVDEVKETTAKDKDKGKEEKKKEPQNKEAKADNKESNTGKTVQLIDPEKLKSIMEGKSDASEKSSEGLSKLEKLKQLKEPPKNLGAVMKQKEAEKFWAEILPEGYSYPTKAMMRNLAKMYGVSKEMALWIIKLSVENAEKAGDTELTASQYINPAMNELMEAMGLESLLRAEYLAAERKKAAAFERKKKIVPTWKSAPKYWGEALPQGYRYARNDMATNLAQFLPNWSFSQMLVLLESAANFAQKDNTNQINYTKHILKAFQELGIQPPM